MGRFFFLRELGSRTLPRAVLVLLIDFGLLGCSPGREAPEDLKDFNVIVIVIDTLRADHLGAYGYERGTSPAIDSLASAGMLFERAYSNSSMTPESVSSLFTGRRPSSAGHTGIAARPHESMTTLGEWFQRDGFTTGFFASNVILNHPAFFEGFDEVEFVIPGGASSGNGAPLTKRALEFAKDHRGERFFMYVHYMDPHGPYDPPAEYYKRFVRHEGTESIALYDEVRANLTTLRPAGFGPGDPRFEDLVDRYDAELAHTDAWIGRLMDELWRLGLLDRTLIVLTSDHGEEFLEHDYVEHGWTLHRESVHVPLIFWQADKLSSGRVERPVELVDVYPTLVELLGIDYSGQDFDGAALLNERGEPTAYSPPLISEMLHEERGDHRSVLYGGWKLMQVRAPLSIEEREATIGTEEEVFWAIWNGERTVDRDTWAVPGYEALFHVAEDPGETTNVIERYPEKAAELRAFLRDYRARALRDAPVTTESETAGAPLDESLTEKLKALGYVE